MDWRAVNIFFTDKNPQLAAQNLCDQHVIKMILESAQMLSTTYRELYGELAVQDKGKTVRKLPLPMEAILYKSTHVNHPMNVWLRNDPANYAWLVSHFWFLCAEYSYRYKGKVHATQTRMGLTLNQCMTKYRGTSAPAGLSHAQSDPWIWEAINVMPPLCMPDEYKTVSVVESYRAYMRGEKLMFGTKHPRPAKWTRRARPEWYEVPEY